MSRAAGPAGPRTSVQALFDHVSRISEPFCPKLVSHFNLHNQIEDEDGDDIRTDSTWNLCVQNFSFFTVLSSTSFMCPGCRTAGIRFNLEHVRAGTSSDSIGFTRVKVCPHYPRVSCIWDSSRPHPGRGSSRQRAWHRWTYLLSVYILGEALSRVKVRAARARACTATRARGRAVTSSSR